MSDEDAAEFGRLQDEAQTIGRQVDIFLGVYEGESTIKTKAQARVAMDRLNEIGLLFQVIIDRYSTS